MSPKGACIIAPLYFFFSTNATFLNHFLNRIYRFQKELVAQHSKTEKSREHKLISSFILFYFYGNVSFFMSVYQLNLLLLLKYFLCDYQRCWCSECPCRQLITRSLKTAHKSIEGFFLNYCNYLKYFMLPLMSYQLFHVTVLLPDSVFRLKRIDNTTVHRFGF